jgi:hypothetical protein
MSGIDQNERPIGHDEASVRQPDPADADDDGLIAPSSSETSEVDDRADDTTAVDDGNERSWTDGWLGVTAYLTLVAAAMIAVIGPSNMSWSGSFIVRGPDVGAPYIVPGDHLQLAYNMWLWHDSITGGGHWPWADPYIFGAAGGSMVLVYGWPLVLFATPISLIWGPIAAYNATVYAGFLLAALGTAWWLRTLRLSRVAAAAGGLAYAFAPFRILQGSGHATSLLAWMFPVLLACLELAIRGPERHARRWAYAAAFTMVSIVLSGEMHHAVFAGLLGVAYVGLRAPGAGMARLRKLVVPTAIGSVFIGIAGVIMYWYVIRPSGASAGRTMNEAAHFAPQPIDLLRPDWERFERYAYVGAVIGVLALIGFAAALVTGRRRRMAVALMIGFVLCCWFSVAPSFVDHPTLQQTYRAVPFFSFSRVPGRLMVVGSLLLAALAALAFDLGRRWLKYWTLIPLTVLLVLDLPLPLHNDLGDGGRPYSALPEGATILEFPVLDPGDAGASIYSWYVTRHPGPRVAGYFVIVPVDRDEMRRTAEILEDDPGDLCTWRELNADTDLDYVAVYRQFFADPAVADEFESRLDAVPGLHRVGTVDAVTTFEVGNPTFGCPEASS